MMPLSAVKISTSHTVLFCFFCNSASTTFPGKFSKAVFIACSIVILAAVAMTTTCLASSCLCLSFSALHTIPPTIETTAMTTAAIPSLFLSIIRCSLLKTQMEQRNRRALDDHVNDDHVHTVAHINLSS